MPKLNTVKNMLNKGDSIRDYMIAVYGNIVHTGVLNRLSDDIFLKLTYRIYTGKKLNLDNPVLLNEKLQWLKIHDRKPEYTQLVDKYKVKEIISDRLGEEYVIPLLGVWNDYDDIDFDSLPEKFILKCTHDSGSIVVCSDKRKLDYSAAKKKLMSRLHRNLYYWGREWPYKDVKPRIIAEQYIENADGSPLVDYKFFCYGGKPRYFMYSIGEAEHHVKNIKYSMDKKPIDYLFKKKPALEADELELPNNIDKMIDIVTDLAKGFNVVRIDLYNVDGHIYFGEFTFSPNNGFINICNEEYARELASYIDTK